MHAGTEFPNLFFDTFRKEVQRLICNIETSKYWMNWLLLQFINKISDRNCRLALCPVALCLVQSRTSRVMEHQDVLLICQKLGLEEDLVLKQYEAFIEKYPAGEMTKKEFVDYCLEKDDTAEENLSEALFNIFDKDSSGSIDFSEYIMASRATKVVLSANPSSSPSSNVDYSAEDSAGKTKLDL